MGFLDGSISLNTQINPQAGMAAGEQSESEMAIDTGPAISHDHDELDSEVDDLDGDEE